MSRLRRDYCYPYMKYSRNLLGQWWAVQSADVVAVAPGGHPSECPFWAAGVHLGCWRIFGAAEGGGLGPPGGCNTYLDDSFFFQKKSFFRNNTTFLFQFITFYCYVNKSLLNCVFLEYGMLLCLKETLNNVYMQQKVT